MAANKCPVTPERVRKILSSFLSDGTNKVSITGEDQESSSPTSKAQGTTTSEKVQEQLNLRSREAFFLRVETFSPLTWFAKPDELSALVCAQYGWENTEMDMLRCVSCKAFLCGKLPPNTDQEAYKEGCRRLKSSITSSHEKMCTWSTNPAPDWYMQVPHYDPTEVRRDFQERYQVLKAAKDTLPEINYAKLMNFGFDTYRCGKLTFSLDQTSEEGLKKAAALAVTGWTIIEKKVTLVCQHCRRHAGLWNFKASAGNGVDTNGNSDPPVKRQKLESKESFDPSDEHRTFCPWIKLKEQESVAANTSPNKSQTTSTSSNVSQPPGPGRNENHNSTTVPHTDTHTSDFNNSQTVPRPGFNNSQTVLNQGFNNFQSPRMNTSQAISSPPNKSQNVNSPGLNTSQDSNTSTDSLGSPDPSEKKVVKSPGWVRNLKIIAPTLLSGDRDSFSSTIKKSPMVVGLRSIRRLFRDWASPDTNKP